MRILFNTPFKPLNHGKLSGDVTIARDLTAFFLGRGHELRVCPNVNRVEIPVKPGLWPAVFRARREALDLVRGFRPDLVFTYHTYYKAPDLVGPCLARAGLPYFIFSGAYAEKRRKRLRTLPGYLLNKRALLASDHIFSNKASDHECLGRILPASRHTRVRQGIHTGDFVFDSGAREELRAAWRAGDRPVLVTAAVLRTGVKVRGVEFVVRCRAELERRGLDPLLVIAGDGPGRAQVEALARETGPESVRFLGMADRRSLGEIFSAGDLFLFPGIDEGLGMVYLEAQSCGLPVVATHHAGAAEVVRHGETGLLVPPFEPGLFADAVQSLLDDPARRRAMGVAAGCFVREVHDMDANYEAMEAVMREVVEKRKNGQAGAHG